ncbi:hypothetical protein BGX24_009440 [Mortierella sp. AD032]|nr:hypothetical protein BGX24_009440 [Mortierella sp. AD032]
MHCTCHRVFLASLIVAAKYLNDQSPKNKHWSAHSTVFSVGEVNLMEKQLLALLDFDLRITEADLASSLHDFLQQQQQSTVSAPIVSTTKNTTVPERPISRYASGMVTPLYPINTAAGKPAAATTSLSFLTEPQDAFRRRPSLPNQPCLEEGETLHGYSNKAGGPFRGQYQHQQQYHYTSQHPHHQNHYPSPDSSSDAYVSQRSSSSSDEEMTPASTSACSPPSEQTAVQRSWPVYGRHSMPPSVTVANGYTHYQSGSSSSSNSVHPHYQGYGHHHHQHAAAVGATSRAMC